MNFIVITPNGDRVPVEDFAGHAVHKIQEGDTGALATLTHARQSRDAAEHAEVAEMIDAMLNAPQRATEIVNSVSDIACTRFAIAMAFAYSERNPGASVTMVPETTEDQSFMASFQRPRPRSSSSPPSLTRRRARRSSLPRRRTSRARLAKIVETTEILDRIAALERAQVERRREALEQKDK